MGLKEEIIGAIGLYFTVEGIISLLEVAPIYQHIGPNADPVVFTRVFVDIVVRMAVPSPFTLFIMFAAALLKMKY